MTSGFTMPGSQTLRFPPFAEPGRAIFTIPRIEEDLPSIDQFVDELPSILDFAAYEPESEPESEPVPAELPFVTDYGYSPRVPEHDAAHDAAGWAISDWQSYNWSSLASLGARHGDRVEADREWTSTQWDLSTGDAEARAHTEESALAPGADEVAAALDGIAQRIRSGELVIDTRGTHPEAAMAAAIAVLLRMRG